MNYQHRLEENSTITTFLIEHNKILVGLLCMFSFLNTFSPGSPFLVTFLNLQKKIPETIIYNTIFPVWSYSSPLVVLLMGFCSELLGHKIVIILGQLGGLISAAIVLLGSTVEVMIVSQITFSAETSSYLIFSSYIYHLTKTKKFQEITSYIRCAYLLGTVLSSLLGQALYVYFKVNLIVLFYLSLACATEAFCIGFGFPLIKREFNVEKTKQMGREVLTVFRNWKFLWYCSWAVVMLSIHHLALTYWQSLFSYIDNSSWNGAVNSIAYSVAAVASLIPIKLSYFLSKNIYGFQILVLLICGTLLFTMGLSTNKILSSTGLILYHSFHEFGYTTASAHIAAIIMKKGQSHHYAIIFSLITLLTYFLQLIVQATVSGLILRIDYQFLVFGLILQISGILFLIKAITKKLKSVSHNNREGVSLIQEHDVSSNSQEDIRQTQSRPIFNDYYSESSSARSSTSHTPRSINFTYN